MKKSLGEGAARHGGRLGVAFLDALDHLGAHPRHRFGIEARMGQRQSAADASPRGAFSLKRDDRDHQIVALDAGAELDGVVGQRFMEGAWNPYCPRLRRSATAAKDARPALPAGS